MLSIKGDSRFTFGIFAAILTLAMMSPAGALTAQRVVICHGGVASSLVALATVQGFFAAEGLDVESRIHPSGAQALEAMLAGQCSLTAATPLPVVRQSLRRNDFRVVANIAVTENADRIIVRSDRGMLRPADLRGRRVAVTEATSPHFLLDMTMVTNGMTAEDVHRTYVQAQDLAPAFRRGDVDAAALWEPNVRELANEFGDRAHILNAAGMGTRSFMLIGRLDYIRQSPASIERILRALLQAEHYARTQPAVTRTTLARFFGMTQSSFDYAWDAHDFSVSLDQALLFDLERVARWSIRKLPPRERPEMPNYLDFIHLDALKAVRRQAVTIIH